VTVSSPIPPLAEWLRWTAEMPPAFRAEPASTIWDEPSRVRVRAVVADLLETLTGETPEPKLLDAFAAVDSGARERNRLGWVLAASHVLWHPWLRASRLDPKAAAGIRRFLVEELATLAAVVPVDRLLTEEERREELVRRALRASGVALPGESAAEREDRLKQVDSLERHRVLAEAAERDKRARAVRDAMAKKAAEEAAAKVSRE
jgi:hypothetical protein